IFIVEDHALFREGLKRVLGEMDDVEFVGEAENGAVFLEKLKKTVPDIVLMDIQMPVMDGLEAADRALKMVPDLKILVISMFGEEEYVYAMVEKGVSGFLLKTSGLPDFEKAIRRIAEGQQYYSEEIMALLVKKIRQIDAVEKVTITGKEMEVLRCLCRGMSNNEIGEKLFLSVRTVEGYRNKLLQKTGSANVINLVIYALKNKLVIL
ncbi:MAG TPA: response regulator transcription factor, partial [Bacteroidales bacterium]|nr:response regulator transcription factor [Bacteroidales bacterium]